MTVRRRSLALISSLVALVLVISGVGLSYAVGAGEDSAKTPSAAEKGGRERKVKLGVFRGTDPAQVAQFSTWLGRDVQYAMDYSPRVTWSDIADPEYVLSVWENSGYRMVYGVAMLPSARNSRATLKAGAKGKYNKYYKKLARNLVKHGQGDAILRLGWEFNVAGFDWSPTTKNRKAFIAYWRQIVKTMRSVPGTKNLQFDWNVNNGGLETYDSRIYYPGNKYVDYVGVDVYDLSWPHYPYKKGCGKTCRHKTQVKAWNLVLKQPNGLRFWSRFARSKGKPLSLPEWGAWERTTDGHGGADNPYFISKMHTFIGNPKNHVAYQAYFDFDVPNGNHELHTLKKAGKRYRAKFGS